MKLKNKKHYCQIFRQNNTPEAPNTSIFRKICILLRNFTTISEKYPLRKVYFRSRELYLGERKRHISGPDWLSIHPFSNFAYCRHFVMLITHLVAIIFDQIDIAFIYKYENFSYFAEECFLILNIICCLNMIVSFLTGYVDKTVKMNLHYYTGYYGTWESGIELKRSKIAKKYLKTFFLTDLFAIINVVHATTNIFEHKGIFYLYACLRHLRLIRLFTAGRLLGVLTKHKQMSPDAALIVRYCFLFLYLPIFLGSLMCYIPDITSYIYNEDRQNYLHSVENFYKMHPGEEYNTFKLFLHAIYDSFCLLFLFRMHKVLHNIEISTIATLTMILGNLLKIILFLTVYSILDRRYHSRVKYNTFYQEVKYYVRALGLDKPFCNEILRYCDHKMKNEYFNETEIFRTLQKNMQYEIFTESSMAFIRSCHLFKNLPTYFLVQLSLRLRCETYVPGVTVITVGEIATCMYFIATGTVAVYSADGTELCHLSDGEYVGEIGILQSTARVADIVTIEHCELYRLDIKDFQEVIKPNSKFYKRIYKIAMKRMNVHVNLEEKK